MADEFVNPTEEYGTPIPPIEEPEGRGNRIWIILAVVVLVLCCCCIVSAYIFYQYLGDPLMEWLGVYSLAPVLLP